MARDNADGRDRAEAAKAAVRALGALAQETRLEVFRRLIVAGPDGLPAGAISALLAIPGPTLTFHMKELLGAGLVTSRKEGRSVIYAASFADMRRLLTFLTEDCCQGRPEICGTGESSAGESSCGPALPRRAKKPETL